MMIESKRPEQNWKFILYIFIIGTDEWHPLWICIRFIFIGFLRVGFHFLFASDEQSDEMKGDRVVEVAYVSCRLAQTDSDSVEWF